MNLLLLVCLILLIQLNKSPCITSLKEDIMCLMHSTATDHLKSTQEDIKCQYIFSMA